MRTDEQIFKEVVEKAIENGFMKGLSVTYEINPRNVVFYNKKTNMRLGLGIYSLPDLFSNHAFMQALCGDKKICRNCEKEDVSNGEFCPWCWVLAGFMKAFHHHQQRIITLPENERLKYLERFITKPDEGV